MVAQGGSLVAQTAGYWVDLRGVSLNEDGPTWIQAMPLGEYNHPVHGKISITPERVQRFAANVKNRVRETDLDIDYDHKALTTEAAGWVKDADARPDGLWLLVDWTRKALQLIREKAFRYFSPEFVDEWEHPRGGKFQDVLFGGGLTNRPFLKDILPINMSEVFSAAPGPTLTEGGKAMTPDQLKILAKIYGLPEDSTAEMILGAAQFASAQAAGQTGDQQQQQQQQQPAQQTGQQGGGQASGAQQGAQQVAASDGQNPDLVKLAETNPALAKYLSDLQSQVAVQGAALRVAEVTQLSERICNVEGGKYTVAPAVRTQLSEVLTLAPKALNDKLVPLFESLLKTGGLVELGERVSARREGREEAANAVKAFTDKVAEVVDKEKMSFADATVVVSAREPQLFANYQAASYAFKEA